MVGEESRRRGEKGEQEEGRGEGGGGEYGVRRVVQCNA